MAVKHIVLFTLKDGFAPEDERVREAAAFSASHVEHISEIQGWELGFDTSHRAVSADFAIVGTFSDSAAVTRYLEHPHHHEGIARWRDIATWTVVDLAV